MSYTISQLNPQGPILFIDGKGIQLSLLTLKMEVVYSEKYGSLQKVFDLIAEDGAMLIPIIWELVTQKEDFQNNPESFQNFILASRQGLIEVGKSLSVCFNESVTKSRPLIKNPERAKVIREISGGADPKKPCYAVYFDTLASRYGYTLETFYDLTLGQLHILLKVIGDKSYEELEVQAALQGRQLNPRMEFEDITLEEEESQEEQAAEALARLRKDYEEKQRIKNG